MKIESKFDIGNWVFIKKHNVQLVRIESISLFKNKILYKFHDDSLLYEESEIFTIPAGTKVKVYFNLPYNIFECFGFMHGISNNKFTLYIHNDSLGNEMKITNVPFSFIKEIYI